VGLVGRHHTRVMSLPWLKAVGLALTVFLPHFVVNELLGALNDKTLNRYLF